MTEQNLYHFSGSSSKEKLKNSYHGKINGYPEDEFEFDLMKSRFDESILSILENAPDTINWMIYFPPYSIAEFIIYDKTDVLDANMDFKKYMITSLSRYSNVELFDFQCSPWITNLEEYMDVHHHSHKYNRAVLQAIHDGEYRADSSGHVEEIRQLIIQYKDSLEQ